LASSCRDDAPEKIVESSTDFVAASEIAWTNVGVPLALARRVHVRLADEAPLIKSKRELREKHPEMILIRRVDETRLGGVKLDALRLRVDKLVLDALHVAPVPNLAPIASLNREMDARLRVHLCESHVDLIARVQPARVAVERRIVRHRHFYERRPRRVALLLFRHQFTRLFVSKSFVSFALYSSA